MWRFVDQLSGILKPTHRGWIVLERAEREAVTLLLPKSFHWIDQPGAAGWDKARQERN
jgi:hypothetical protein